MNVSSVELTQVLVCTDDEGGGGGGIIYLGDFPLDEIPPVDSVLQKQQQQVGRVAVSLIVNCDDKSKPGSHWIALVVTPPPPAIARRQVLFIEPMGLERTLLNALPPLRDWFQKVVNALSEVKAVTILPYPIQPLHSTLCGAYCGYIIKKLPLYNFNLDALTRREFLTQQQLDLNDQRMAAWWYKRRDACTS